MLLVFEFSTRPCNTRLVRSYVGDHVRITDCGGIDKARHSRMTQDLQNFENLVVWKIHLYELVRGCLKYHFIFTSASRRSCKSTLWFVMLMMVPYRNFYF